MHAVLENQDVMVVNRVAGALRMKLTAYTDSSSLTCTWYENIGLEKQGY